MGFRFRRSVRLFPGVRLNFSRSGVSTSVGVRGASMTFGSHGTYANVGIPGSGLSYRTRLDAPAPRQRVVEPAGVWSTPERPARGPIFSPGVASIPGTEVEVRSADVEALTTPGLDELKHLIIEATSRHAELQSELDTKTKVLKRATRKLRWAEFPVIRLFTAKAIPRLVDAANNASDEVEDTRAHLEGCFVEVDFAFDAATRASYDALVRAFENLKSAQRIWDITAKASVDQVRQRTTAFTAITRVPVRFDFASAEIVRSEYPAMRLGNVGGRDLQIYPGFVMMREGTRDFALIEFPQMDCELAQSNYIEEESVPSDSVQIGTTWKRANKDGSRDRRFNDNYQIPIMRYGALAFSSPTGLAEVYQISSYDKAASFAQAVAAHKRALANLHTPDDLPALPAPTDTEADHESAEPAHEPVFVAKLRKNLAVDWILLAILMIGLAVGTRWIMQNGQRAGATPPPPTAVAATSVASLAQPTMRSVTRASAHVRLKKGPRHKSRRHRADGL
jgi:hypothetical protein